jgi:hypothetical protein
MIRSAQMLHRSANQPLTDRIQIGIAKDVSFFFERLSVSLKKETATIVKDSYRNSLRNEGIFSIDYRRVEYFATNEIVAERRSTVSPFMHRSVVRRQSIGRFQESRSRGLCSFHPRVQHQRAVRLGRAGRKKFARPAAACEFVLTNS